jgi:hypothetical protein
LAALALGVLAIGGGATAQETCPVIDPSQSIEFFRFPPEAKSLLQAQLDPSGTGQEGVDRIVDIVRRSFGPGCTPVRVVIVLGGADFDSRGTGFEDYVSVERAMKAAEEIAAAARDALNPLYLAGEIGSEPVIFTFGGRGTRRARHRNPTSEAERSENRTVSVRLAAASPDAPPADRTSETGAREEEGFVPEASGDAEVGDDSDQ